VLCLIVLDRMRNPRNFSPLFFAVGGGFFCRSPTYRPCALRRSNDNPRISDIALHQQSESLLVSRGTARLHRSHSHHETLSSGAPGPSIVDLHTMQSSQLFLRRASPRWKQVQEEPPRCTGQNPVRTVADRIPSSWIPADRIVQLPLGETDGRPVPTAN
jgi:hypothetical protein